MATRGAFVFAVLLVSAVAGSTAYADAPAYVRVQDTISLRPLEVQSSLGAEVVRPLSPVKGGVGSGTGQYQGVNERLSLRAGLVGPLQVSLEGAFRQLSSSDVRVAGLAPLATVVLPVGENWHPFLTAGARVRLQATRPSTAQLGAGVAGRFGRVHLSAVLAIDGLTGDDRRTRYEAAAAWQLTDVWTISAESWGVRSAVLAGGEGTADHIHLGARRTLGPLWLGAQCGTGRNASKGGDIQDAGCLLVVGGGVGKGAR